MSSCSCQVDSRMDAGYSSRLAAEEEPNNEPAQSVNNPLLEEEAREASAYISNRFLHSDENLLECHTDDDGEEEDNDDENLSKEKRRSKQAAFLHDSSSNNNDDRSSIQWANRQLHRSVSVDDLMEYQREFRIGDVGRSNSAHDLMTDYQREFQAILAEHPTTTSSSNDLHKLREEKPLPTVAATAAVSAATTSRGKRSVRNSIANSDLAEFKRQFSHAIRGDNPRRNSNNTARRSPPRTTRQEEETNENAVAVRKLENLKNSMDYQWGTRSLRKAMLGSDFGTFERSVRTALLESSRENSSAGSIDSTDDDDDDYQLPEPPLSRHNFGIYHRDSCEKRPTTISMKSSSNSKDQEEDWGTRSLRKSLKELDLTEPSTTEYLSRPSFDRVGEGEIITLPLEASLQNSFRTEDNIHPSSNGLKMPRRVTSSDTDRSSDRTAGSDDNNHIDQPKMPSRKTSAGESSTIHSEEPEFEWQLRSCFRRSISSSDIEKYQRHLEDKGMGTNGDDGGGNDGDSAGGSIDDRSVHTVPSSMGLSSIGSPSTAPQSNLHPLLANLPHTSTDLLADDNCNSEDEEASSGRPPRHPSSQTGTQQPQRPRRASRQRHRRSNSDEPELHMENVMADVAPRKPTRTTSRPMSPPPPRDVVVRFAENCTQVVEIPKVSEDLKPYLFYTKRDVKRFRMNEHRRQEEQIRSYMEYLNQKENVLDSSPCIFD